MAELSDAQWDKIKDVLPGKKSDRGRTAVDNRLFVEAVYWVGRNGSNRAGTVYGSGLGRSKGLRQCANYQCKKR
ncbi:MAG: transposase [Vampirovibrionales bacterium]|nr:transposase [Vampirovibrionales bacterium]